MKDKQLTVKQDAFCKWLFTPGSEIFGNATESARRAGYKGNTGTLATVGKENIRKPQIIAEKARIQAITAKKLDLSRQAQHEKLERAFKIAEDGKNPSAMATVIREQNEMLGYHRDKAPNTERIEQIRRRMDEEELLYRQEHTVRRCLTVSQARTGVNVVLKGEEYE